MIQKLKKNFKSLKRYLLIYKNLLSTPILKMNIGAGKFGFEFGWFLTDIDTLNILDKNSWRKNLVFKKANTIMAEHVWEHLSYENGSLGAANCFAFLKQNGSLRLAVPDGYHPDKNYIEYVKPGGQGPGADDHKLLYNYLSIKKMLEDVGFKVNLLEYWDEFGEFHFEDWTDEAGHISRSRRYDKRNQDGKLNYTSLIVDAIKP